MNNPTDTQLLDWLETSGGYVSYMEQYENWYVDYWDHGERKTTPFRATARKALIDAYNGVRDE